MTATIPSRRGTSNGNARGSSTARRRRREWLVETYRADRDIHPLAVERLEAGETIPRQWSHDGVPVGQGVPACRCFRCGRLLTAAMVTVDRIFAGKFGGLYGTPKKDRERLATNARPCCGRCNSATGGAIASRPTKKADA